jgi:ABC-type transporter lipoprotein component MlaA
VKKAVIENLFPTPIYMSNIDRPFTKQELQFVDNQKNKCSKNLGNINTKDNYILNRKEFKNVKKFLDQCCKDYLRKNYIS